jgi:hypothetical protein
MARGSAFKVWTAIAIALGAGIAAVPARSEHLQADVTFIEVQNEIRPRRIVWRQPRQITMSLSHGHVVNERQVRRAGRPDEHTKRFESVLGAETQVRRSRVTWRFLRNDTLVRIAETSSYRMTATLTFRSGTCSVDIRYALKPGHSYFAMSRLDSGKPMVVDHLTAETASCSIKEDMTS